VKLVREHCPEFCLLLNCCRWNFATGRDERPSIRTDLNWVYFARLARFHLVQGLAWNALAPNANRIPQIEAEQLSSDARAIAATNLGIAHECASLYSEFAKSGLPILFVKGLTVGALSYRSPMLKMGWDIDVLIDPANLSEAADILLARGFSLRLPAGLADLPSWHSRSKESVWGRADGVHVELHTRLVDNRAFLPSVDVNSPSQIIEVTRGVNLPTLAKDELLAYLCVHGASSAWFRLKWISDFAALLHPLHADELQRLYDRSQELGAHRAAAQAFLLADALYGSLDGTNLRARLSEDRSNLRLAESAFRQVTKSREPTSTPLGTWRIHLTQLLLKPGLGFKVSEAARQLSAALA